MLCVYTCTCAITNVSYRKNHQRQLDALQQSLEEENKAKNDANRQKKAAEERLYELEGNLESSQKVNYYM